MATVVLLILLVVAVVFLGIGRDGVPQVARGGDRKSVV